MSLPPRKNFSSPPKKEFLPREKYVSEHQIEPFTKQPVFLKKALPLKGPKLPVQNPQGENSGPEKKETRVFACEPEPHVLKVKRKKKG